MDNLDELLDSEQRLRIWADWLGRSIEGTVSWQLWRGDVRMFFFEADDGEVYAFERADVSLRVELVATT
jgi:hypothetical protein